MTDAALAPPARTTSALAKPSRDEERDASVRSQRCDMDAERAVLSAVLIDNQVLPIVRAVLEPADFFHGAHSTIFKSMCALYDANDPIDALTLRTDLTRRGSFNGVGGHRYIAELLDATPTTANAEAHALLIVECSNVRKLGRAGQEIVSMAFDASTKAEDIVAKGTAVLSSLSLAKRGSSDSATFAQVAEGVLVPRTAGATPIDVRPTHLRDLNKLLSGGGWCSGQLITIAARPMMGKTSLAAQIAREYAKTLEAAGRNDAVLFFSLEMPKSELCIRDIAAEADVDGAKVKSQEWDAEEQQRIFDAVNRLWRIPLVYVDRDELSFDDFRAICLQKKQECGQLGLVVIDYVQLMRVKLGRDDNRVRALSELTRNLKTFAKVIGCPIIILSQLNRDLEKRTNKRPMLSDLRESGSIEQDSDIVVFIYRDEVYKKDSEDKGFAEVILAKQRNGPTGTVRTLFRGERTSFLNVPDAEHVEDLESTRYPSSHRSPQRHTRSRRSSATPLEEEGNE